MAKRKYLEIKSNKTYLTLRVIYYICNYYYQKTHTYAHTRPYI